MKEYQKLLEQFPKGKDTIGHVLEKIKMGEEDKGISYTPKIWMGEDIEKTVGIWKPLGFTKSLQEILEKELEEVETTITPKNPKEMWDGRKKYVSKQLKPEAKELFDFLEKIII